MLSPTPAGDYIFLCTFQSCHMCNKRTVRTAVVQGAHKARPSSEGALWAPASSSSLGDCPVGCLTCCLILTQQEFMRTSCERQQGPPPSASSTLADSQADGCSFHVSSHLQHHTGSPVQASRAMHDPWAAKWKALTHTKHMGKKCSN